MAGIATGVCALGAGLPESDGVRRADKIDHEVRCRAANLQGNYIGDWMVENLNAQVVSMEGLEKSASALAG
jgi:energy-converting hydrogenase Eha subunit B